MSDSMNNICEDTYFLDRDLAYQTALAHNTVLLDDGRKHEQVCYYDGPPFLLAPNNLINVPAEQFSEYFTDNPQRFPKRIDTTITRSEVQTSDFQKRVQGMVSMLTSLQKSDCD